MENPIAACIKIALFYAIMWGWYIFFYAKIKRIILASASKERAKTIETVLAGGTNNGFEIIPADIDETELKDELPRGYVKRIAYAKAAKISSENPDAIVIGADTIVAVGRRILRKAQSPEEARSQMNLLSGRRHRVYTGISVISKAGANHRVSITHIAVKLLSQQEIEQFVQSNEWKGVAVYKISGIAGKFIRSINGLEGNVRGLSLYDAAQMLVFHISQG